MVAVPDDEDDRGRWRRGAVIGDHVLEKCVGEGGFGEVWRAHDQELDRVVAIKRLHWRGADDRERDELRARFLREAKMTAKLRHPHIPTVYRWGEDRCRCPYVITEFVDGGALDTPVRAGPLPPPDGVAVVVQVAEALAHAHGMGIVHRDIKPDNVMLRASDRHVYVVDFGIGALLDVDRSRLTRTGWVIGSLPYIAPERMPLDGSATAEPHPGFDVYAMACLLHECLTGSRAFTGSGEMQLIRAHHAARRPRPSDVDAHLSAFDDVVVRALAVRLRDRTPSAVQFQTEVLAALTAWERSAAPSDGPSATVERPPRDASESDRKRSAVLGSPWTVGALTGIAGSAAALGLGGGLVVDMALIVGSYAAGVGGACWWRRSGGGDGSGPASPSS